MLSSHGIIRSKLKLWKARVSNLLATIGHSVERDQFLQFKALHKTVTICVRSSWTVNMVDQRMISVHKIWESFQKKFLVETSTVSAYD